MERIDRIIADTLSRWEGGYVNHPADRGGPTNMGITQRTLAAFRGRPVTADAVRTLSRAEAVTIYRQRYWSTTGVDRLPESLQPVVFDSAVNLGPGTAVRLLQQALGDLGAPVTVDGVLGSGTATTAARLVAERGAGPVVRACPEISTSSSLLSPFPASLPSRLCTSGTRRGMAPGGGTTIAAEFEALISGQALNAVCDRRQQRYDAIVAADPAQACFRAGWQRRGDSFRLST